MWQKSPVCHLHSPQPCGSTSRYSKDDNSYKKKNIKYYISESCFCRGKRGSRGRTLLIIDMWKQFVPFLEMQLFIQYYTQICNFCFVSSVSPRASNQHPEVLERFPHHYYSCGFCPQQQRARRIQILCLLEM